MGATYDNLGYFNNDKSDKNGNHKVICQLIFERGVLNKGHSKKSN